MLKMIIIRGLPGSGKTTMAREMLKNAQRTKELIVHTEADGYFTNINGYYYYKPELKAVAHRWCEEAVKDALLNGNSVIVSNTFTTYSEMIPYLILAREYGARVEVITCKGEFKSTHNVPEDVIQRMKERWED